ncbi:MAG TPA: uroporphyrinogen decarboxylase family protein [Anaerolinea sp.]|nr:uroporphyrinogen decarboxylase family protein [Anaerolinea sp.]
MPTSSRELVRQTVLFQRPARLPYDLPDPYGSDFFWTGLSPSPDDRPPSGVDEWGAVWENKGNSKLGEVKGYPLKDWADFERLHIPDIREPRRWEGVRDMRERAGERFLLCHGLSIYARVHYIRGLENTWIDIYEAPDRLGELLDILVEMNLYIIRRYAENGADGVIIGDDWGLQDRLMISPKAWRAIWKPRYARIFAAVREAGMLAFLHSCGYIVDILDDLIEIGLQVVHMDQQENMGLETLGGRFGGRLTFFSPVDIQKTMVYGSTDEIRAYAREMARRLGTPLGGFIPRWYSDPVGAGHSPEALRAMCEEFLALSAAFTG